ncbi:hypothetical protein BDR22DRAFT_834634 [Usnea florida]
MKPVVSALNAWSCVVVSVFAIIILSVIGGLFKVCAPSPPLWGPSSSQVLLRGFYGVEKIVDADGCGVVGGPS